MTVLFVFWFSLLGACNTQSSLTLVLVTFSRSLVPPLPVHILLRTHTHARARLCPQNEPTLRKRNGTQVFDTCNVHNDRAYGLHFHLDRFLKCAATARIEHGYTKEALRDIILATIAAGGRTQKGTDAFAKFWLSAGRQERVTCYN